MPQAIPQRSTVIRPGLFPVVGAHGTGKSTLLRTLAGSAFGEQLTVGSEIPRIICELAGRADYFQRGVNTLPKQIHLLFEQLATEVSYSATSTTILDRSLLDHFAYTRVLFGDELADSRLGDIINRRLGSLCARYAAIFYVPVEIPLVGDGIREADVDFQRHVDEEILNLLKQHRPDYIVLRGSIAQRAETLEQHIQQNEHS